jgi:hypothetical protein
MTLQRIPNFPIPRHSPAAAVPDPCTEAYRRTSRRRLIRLPKAALLQNGNGHGDA